MFFSGDPSARKRVDLGGRSNKERDRKVLLDQTREERRRRQALRLQNSSATKIQKFFRGKKALELARSEIRKNFCSTFGDHCERIDWSTFGTNSDFLHQLLFFFNANEDNDIAILCQVCNLLLQYVKHGGDLITLFTGTNDSSLQPLVAHRVKKLTLICIQAVYQKRHDWSSQLLTSSRSTPVAFFSLLETVACLINPKLPWNCIVVGYLQRQKIYCLFRGIIISVPQNARNLGHVDSASALEQVIMLVASHVGHHSCCCPIVDPRWTVSSQLLSIPFLWRRLPHFKKVFSINGLSKHYIHQIASCLPSLADVLPNDISANQPGFACVLANVLEAATWILSDTKFASDTETADHLLYPNPGSGLVHEQHLQYFHFLGSLLGKAMYEGILVDLPFATFFLSKLKQKYNFLNDLPSLDPELYRHLLFLKHYNGNISELELYFVIVNNEYGEQCEEELLPGGRGMRVTNDNVITFIHLVANHRLNYQIRAQSIHFLRGFQQLIPKDWIDMFSEHEIQLLISGSLESLNIDDLRSNTNYSGGYHTDHELIEMFWEVLKSFSSDNQKRFLKFVTGCSRGPLLGFQYLEPKFCIQRAGVPGMEEHGDRLPTSATCMNLLKLPPYKTKEQLQTKLLYAINSEAGFDLS